MVIQTIKESGFMKKAAALAAIIAVAACSIMPAQEAYAVDETSRYYHLDFRIDATVTITILNEDGTTSTEEVTGTISNPSARIYHTSTLATWSQHSWVSTDETTGLKYFDVTFKDETSSDNGSYEYMMNPNGTPGRQDAEFYNGDTVELSYTLTYTYNGKTYELDLSETRVLAESDNLCNSKSESGSRRGFDIAISTENISAAMSTSQMQIAKQWNDNNSVALRPSAIAVKVYQTVNEAENLYMTLTLASDKGNSTYEMASGVSKDEDTVITFSDDYGVTITGLPQNYWVQDSSGAYSYVSCSYSAKEVQAVTNAGSAITPVYGSLVYVDKPETDSYVITITNTLGYDDLAVKKEWADSETDNHDGDSVEVELKAYYMLNGVETEVPEEWLANFIGREDGETDVVLNDANGWYAEWGNMPAYYTPDSETAYEITRFEAVETSISVDNGETYTTTVSGISESVDAEGNYYITVTNTPQPKTTNVTISKEVTGNMGDLSKEFTFKAKIVSDGVAFAPADYTLDSEGCFTFTLSDGESLELNDVPIGSEITISEIGLDGTNYKVLIDGVVDDDGSITTTVPEAGLTVQFENNLEMNIDTGLLLNGKPYLFVLLGTAVAVIAGVAVFVRKNRFED